MIIKVKQDFMVLIINALSNAKFSKMNKPRKYFIAHTLWLFASVKTKPTWLCNFCMQNFLLPLFEMLSMFARLLPFVEYCRSKIQFSYKHAAKVRHFCLRHPKKVTQWPHHAVIERVEILILLKCRSQESYTEKLK